MKKKILVVFYSLFGNTRKAGLALASLLGADTEELFNKKRRTGIMRFFTDVWEGVIKRPMELDEIKRKPGLYDLVVIGTPVWGSDMAPAVRAYIMRYKSEMKRMACFETSGECEPAVIWSAMEKLAGKKAVASAGWKHSERKDRAVYEEKIKEFAGRLRAV